MARPPLRLAFSDFWPGFDPPRWGPVRALGGAFEVHVDPEARILVFGPYGRRHVRHPGTKVAWTHEAWSKPVNECDFSVGFEFSADPTHLRFPSFVSLLIGDAFDGRVPARPVHETWKQRPYFCNFIYSNEMCSERKAFFHALSRRRHVLAPGTVHNNTMPIPGGRYVHDWRRRKLAYQQSFRFTIAFENVAQPGYTSEKLVDALVSGTIPIYWGNPRIDEDVNRSSFINAADFASLDELADYVCAVDAEETLARRYLAPVQFVNVPIDRWTSELAGFFEGVREFSGSRRLSQHLRVLRLSAREAPTAMGVRGREMLGRRGRDLSTRSFN